MAENNENNPSILSIEIGTRAASVTIPAGCLPKKSKIHKCLLMDGAGVPLDAVNFTEFALKTVSGTLIASSTQETGQPGAAALVANTALEMVMESGQDIQAAGTSMKLEVTKNGTGVPTDAKLLILHSPL